MEPAQAPTLYQNLDLLLKLTPFILAIVAQYVAFRLLKQNFEAHIEIYKEDKAAHKEEQKLQWEKFDKLKESVDALNSTVGRLTGILEYKGHRGLNEKDLRP